MAVDLSVLPGVRRNGDGMLEIRGQDGGWHIWHGSQSAYPHHNVTWLLRKMTHTGTVDPLTGIGTEAELLEASDIRQRTQEWARTMPLALLREQLAGQARVVAHETAVLEGLKQAVASRG